LAPEPVWKTDEVKYLLLLPGILPQTTTCHQSVLYEIWELLVMEINRVHFECTVKGVIFNTADPEGLLIGNWLRGLLYFTVS
jgi:hypothetical protein